MVFAHAISPFVARISRSLIGLYIGENDNARRAFVTNADILCNKQTFFVKIMQNERTKTPYVD